MPPKAKTGSSAVSPFYTRLMKDIEEVKVRGDGTITFPDPDNMFEFHVRIKPSDGLWHGRNFDFSFDISNDWPYKPPKVMILTRIWHPNMDEEGNVCLNVLRENYNPCCTINSLIACLIFLFVDPNPHSPLNFEASQQYIQNYDAFKAKAEQYMDEFCPKD